MRRVVRFFGPMVEISRLQSELNRLFSGFIESNRTGAPSVGTWDPNIDIIEANDQIQVIVELPGVEGHDLELSIRGRILTIKGNKKGRVRPRESVKFLCMERYFGSFVKTITLSVPVNTHRGTARLSEGVLTVTFPRVPDLREREIRIPIEGGSE